MLLAAIATGLIALWLFFVTAAVLPVRDPQRVGTWAALASGLVIYAGCTLWLVLRGARPLWVPWCVTALSLIEVPVGAYMLREALTAAPGHFEGYLVVMGLVQATHGALALAYIVFVVAPQARRARTGARAS